MSKGINIIKKNKVKTNILNGDSYKQAVLKAGYSPNSAINANRLAVVKCCLKEIEDEFRVEEVTVKQVLARLNYLEELSIQKGDLATATRCEELKGKYLAMFTDKSEISTIEKEDNQFSLERLSRIKQAEKQ